MDKSHSYILIRHLLDGLVPSRFRSVILHWLLSDSEQSSKMAALKSAWDEIGADVEPTTEQELAVWHQKWFQRQQAMRTRQLMVRILRYAAVVMLPIIVGVAVWQYAGVYYKESDLVECFVPDGKIDSLLLSDGTKVRVNAGTTIYYPRQFNAKYGSRHVYLLGEAHFEVAKDVKHPFVVHVGHLNIQVLGTKFNVKAYNDEDYITTTLEEGSVKLTDSVSTILLHPNEQALYRRKDGLMRRRFVDVGDYNGWQYGEIRFDAVPLHKILAGVGRKYGIHFNVDQSVDLSHVYTMNFKGTETIEDVMRVISDIGNGLVYEKENNVIKLYRSRKEATQ